ncbi:long-chain-fatty-acyl-CoA reductase [Yinghuangia sp. ASG 101]|uniref:acyl-CoA reductase n=1 Tax=Yinghuangia sp. ASG 101 TaxID=2896848 RepID=UPI001E2BF582|nr:acyl-CoA reductase [Yinghuangia sp. ASG 101]UGQ11194.1 long-chain-fatty-acyl-CoA reductase [Yinghuangia sp. ASG 101]
MSTPTTGIAPATTAPGPRAAVFHMIKGDVVTGAVHEFGSADRGFTTPALDLDALVWPRIQPPPALDVPLAEVMDVLVETGKRIAADPDGLMAEALDAAVRTGTLPRDVLERSYAALPRLFDRRSMEFQVDQELGGADVVDGWREVGDAPSGRRHRVRAFPPRLVHILAGNAPGVSALSIIRGALTKGVHLFKLPSNDLFTAPAILRAMADAAPGHPVVRSFSAVYWRGGDERVEGTLFRPQFFDKLVAWGGESALRSAQRYVGPGFELVAFDPKTSISLIGKEAFVSDKTLADAADRAATDATGMNQQACASSRFQFVEGTTDQVDRFCAALHERLGVERPTCSAVGSPLPPALREEIDGMRDIEGLYRVWGDYSGTGVVVRSEEPVDFHPDGRVVNVVRVRSLADGLRHANVATQTVGVYPSERKAEVRDGLAAAGVQRVVELGGAVGMEAGLPHDGFLPLHRFVRWVNDEG